MTGRLRLLVAVLCLLLVAGCSGAAATDREPTSADPEPSELLSPVARYLHAVSADSPEGVRDGLEDAAPGSPAAAYLTHRANRMQAELEGALTLYPGTVELEGDQSHRLCNPARARCLRFGDFSVDGSGQVVDFAVDGHPIGPRLAVGDGKPVDGSLGSVTFLTAYHAVRHEALVVTLRLHADATPLSPRLHHATFTGADGTQRTATAAHGATDVPAHTDAVVELVFPASPPRGRVTVGACARTSCRQHFSVTVDVG